MAEESNGSGAADEWCVLFGQRAGLGEVYAERTVVIVPSTDGWNDFGHYTRIEYHIHTSVLAEPCKAAGYIGFVESAGELNGKDLLQKIVETPDTVTVPASSEHRFFTMLPEMEAYRGVVRALGVREAVAVMKAVNDVVALREFSIRSVILNLAIHTEVFALSFMREAESYFAYKNAGSILRGLSSEEKGVLSPTLAITFQLSGFVNPHEFEFRFEHSVELPKRIAVIIGKNGVGKSQTLGRIARAALDGSPALTDGTEGGRPLLNRLLAFAPTNEAESVFPSERRKQPRMWYRRHSMNRSRRTKYAEHVSDLIVQIARSKQEIAGKSRWKIFIDAVSAVGSDGELYLASRSPPPRYIPLWRLMRGSEKQLLQLFDSIDVTKEPVRVVDDKGLPLSSGEISFLKFAAQVSLQIDNGSLLLLDEPETHLHPNFISRFVALLDSLLESTGSAAIIATHSVYFVREVFRDQVTVLTVDDDRKVVAQRPMLRTFGADVGAISYFVFGEDEPSKLGEKVKTRLATGTSWPKVYARYKDELSLEMLNALRADLEEKEIP